MGHEVLIDPVLEIRPLPLPPLCRPDCRRRWRSPAPTPYRRWPGSLPAVPVFAVGAGHGRGGAAPPGAQRSSGRRRATARSGAADRSVRSRRSRRDPAPRRAREVREGLEAGLVDAGYRYRRAAVYEAVPGRRLAPERGGHRGHERLDAVLLYSPRSAAFWAAADRGGRASARGSRPCSPSASARPWPRRWPGSPFARSGSRSARDQKALLRCLDGYG